MLNIKSTDTLHIVQRENTKGFDGHSLRAQTYYSEVMPDIELASESSVCYKANADGIDILFHDGEDIDYLGTKMKGRQLYELLTSQRV